MSRGGKRRRKILNEEEERERGRGGVREGEEVGDGDGGGVEEREKDPLAYYERVRAMKRERKKLRKEVWEKRRKMAEEEEIEDEEIEEGKRAITYQVNKLPPSLPPPSL